MPRKIKEMYALAALQQNDVMVGLDWTGEAATLTIRSSSFEQHLPLTAEVGVELMLSLVSQGWVFTDKAYREINPHCGFGLDYGREEYNDETGCQVIWEDASQWSTSSPTLRSQIAEFMGYMEGVYGVKKPERDPDNVLPQWKEWLQEGQGDDEGD